MNREQAEKDQAMRFLFDYWDEDELDRIVLVIPDNVAVEPFDIFWIDKNSPFECRIIILGNPICADRFETSHEEMILILKNLITYGIPIIHKENLNPMNSQYLSKINKSV